MKCRWELAEEEGFELFRPFRNLQVTDSTLGHKRQKGENCKPWAQFGHSERTSPEGGDRNYGLAATSQNQNLPAANDAGLIAGRRPHPNPFHGLIGGFCRFLPRPSVNSWGWRPRPFQQFTDPTGGTDTGRERTSRVHVVSNPLVERSDAAGPVKILMADGVLLGKPVTLSPPPTESKPPATIPANRPKVYRNGWRAREAKKHRIFARREQARREEGGDDATD